MTAKVINRTEQVNPVKYYSAKLFLKITETLVNASKLFLRFIFSVGKQVTEACLVLGPINDFHTLSLSNKMTVSP